jgi:hypothetical protein
MGYQPIENYGVIGDMHAVALVGMNGAIDWFRFQTEVFAASGGRAITQCMVFREITPMSQLPYACPSLPVCGHQASPPSTPSIPGPGVEPLLSSSVSNVEAAL